ncbi:MAG: hypothetical protein JRD89_00425 [Deltaproteobacteria bacterium]|nr:hypothetical protein [Deltaproteobacteria bacterium]
MGRGAWNPGIEFKYQADVLDPGQPEPLVVTYHDWAEDHEEAKIFHYRLLQDGKQPLPHGGMTIAYDSSSGQVGVALCSIKDQFNRRLGRMIAEGRLRNGGAIYIGPLPLSNQPLFLAVIELVLAHLKDDHRYQAWEKAIQKAVNATGTPIFLAWRAGRTKQWHTVKAFGPKQKAWRSWRKTVMNGKPS